LPSITSSKTLNFTTGQNLRVESCSFPSSSWGTIQRKEKGLKQPISAPVFSRKAGSVVKKEMLSASIPPNSPLGVKPSRLLPSVIRVHFLRNVPVEALHTCCAWPIHFQARPSPEVLIKLEPEFEDRAAMSEPAHAGPRLGCAVTVCQHTEIRITEVEQFNLEMNGRQIPQTLFLPLQCTALLPCTLSLLCAGQTGY